MDIQQLKKDKVRTFIIEYHHQKWANNNISFQWPTHIFTLSFCSVLFLHLKFVVPTDLITYHHHFYLCCYKEELDRLIQKKWGGKTSLAQAPSSRKSEYTEMVVRRNSSFPTISFRFAILLLYCCCCPCYCYSFMMSPHACNCGYFTCDIYFRAVMKNT